MKLVAPAGTHRPDSPVRPSGKEVRRAVATAEARARVRTPQPDEALAPPTVTEPRAIVLNDQKIGALESQNRGLTDLEHGILGGSRSLDVLAPVDTASVKQSTALKIPSSYSPDTRWVPKIPNPKLNRARKPLTRANVANRVQRSAIEILSQSPLTDREASEANYDQCNILSLSTKVDVGQRS